MCDVGNFFRMFPWFSIKRHLQITVSCFKNTYKYDESLRNSYISFGLALEAQKKMFGFKNYKIILYILTV